MKQCRVPPIVTVGLVVLSALGMVVVSWYRVGDQTDWSAFEAPQCDVGTCGPEDFNLAKLDYVIRPFLVSDHTNMIIERIAPIVLVVPLVAALLLIAFGRIRIHVLAQLMVILALAAFAGAALRSATAASIGAIIFGGIDVLGLAIAIVIAAAICVLIQRAAGPATGSTTD